MKKILNYVLISIVALCSIVTLAACKDKNEEYVPNLTKTYSANGFEIKATNDFALLSTGEGVKLKSEGDSEVCFGDTYIYAQYDMGNQLYDFQNVSLQQYTSDIAKIENVNIGTPVKNITITEKLNEIFHGDLVLNMYVIDNMQNPNGDWDYYTILCVGKGSNAFVQINVNTTIQDEYYDDNIKKLSSIIGSTIFSTPSDEKGYNDSVKSYISSTIVKTQDVMGYWKFNFALPNDYIAYEVPNYITGNHLQTSYALEEHWSSTIRCSNLASFMGNAILEDDGAKHLIKFSTNNYLGFYTKDITNERSVSYNIYYIDSTNKLNVYYISVGVLYSENLNNLGFGSYFEEQMISWMSNVELLP